MKNNITTLLFLCLAMITNAQLKDLDTRFFQMKFPTIVTECDIDGKAKSATLVTAEKAKFTIVGETNTHYIVMFWEYSESDPNYGLFNKDTSTTKQANNDKYFLIPTDKLKTFAVGIYREKFQYTLGTVVVPVKLRFAPTFDFSKDFALGLSLGAKFRTSQHRKEYIVPVLFSTITSITLDSLTTAGRVNKRRDEAGYSAGIGLVFEFEEGQIGAFLGYDHISKLADTNWQFHGKPWLSIGVGYSIFSSGKKDSQSTAAGTNKW